MIKTIYIAIDPGASGGIAVYGTRLSLFKMPATEQDINSIFASLVRYSINRNIKLKALIEKQHTFPGQGISSSGKLMQNYGFLRGILTANEIPFDEVSPQRWQRHFSLQKANKKETKVKHKNRIKAKAQQLYPKYKITLATSDAIMICEYLKQTDK